MADLAEFLLARVAEDEASNRRGPEPEAWCDRGEGVHYDYARVLAECEAKRRIVQAWQEAALLIRATADEANRSDIRFARIGLETAMEALAQVYADHPEFDEAWRP